MTKKVLIIIPLLVLLAGYGTWYFTNQKAKTLVDTRIAEIIENGEYRELDYESLKIDVSGDIAMKNLHVIDSEGNEYILENIRITDFDYMNEVPRHLDLSASGFRFPAGIPEFGDSPNNSLNDYLGTIMEEDFLPLEINYRYKYQPDAELGLESDVSITLPESFQFTARSMMTNVSMEEFTRSSQTNAVNPAQFSMIFQNADIPTANMALKDLGLVNAVMTIQGESLGVSGEQYREQLIAQLQTTALFIPQQLQSLAQEILSNVGEFLEGEKTLNITITPEYDGNVQKLQGEIMGAFYIGNFTRISELLNFEIETVGLP